MRDLVLGGVLAHTARSTQGMGQRAAQEQGASRARAGGPHRPARIEPDPGRRAKRCYVYPHSDYVATIALVS